MGTFDSQHVVIVGAGLAGSLLACSLGRLGFRVTLVERRPDPRASGFIGGRSINLALSCRGITALEREGLAERVLADAIAMPGRMLHATSGDTTFQPYSANTGDAINSVSRSNLNLTMLRAASENSNVEMRFGLRCTDIEFASEESESKPVAVFEDEASAEMVRIEADCIIGADGAFSAVRGAMQKTDRFDYSQSYLQHGFKELVIPPAQDCGVDPALHDGFALEPHALHIWPRGRAMMIALPNQDKTFTCTLFWPFEGDDAFDQIDPNDGATVRSHFDEYYPDASRLMPTLESDYAGNPVGSLVTVRCAPWQRGGNVALVGDAAHAIVPFFGQGINAGFEDCRILVELIEETKDLAGAISTYGAGRKADADAIADMAIANFTEMRDTVGHDNFLYHKKIEQTLHAALPDRITPKYNMVSFTNVPYSQALRDGNRLAAVVAQVALRVPRPEGTEGSGGRQAWLAEVVRIGAELLETGATIPQK